VGCWLYKATKTRLDRQGTLLLAGGKPDGTGFICRSAHDRATGNRAKGVRDVEIGHTITLHYGGYPKSLGEYRIIAREEHSHPERFGERVNGTALYTVVDPAFIREIDTGGAYQPDVVLGVYTGWLVRRIGPGTYSPDFARGRDTLKQLPGQ